MKTFVAIIISLLVFNTAQSQTLKVERSSKIVMVGQWRYYVYKVAKGQTIYSISKAYNVSEESILQANPQLSQGLKAKQTILIPTQATYKHLLESEVPEPIKEPEVAEIQEELIVDTTEIIEPDQPLTTGRTREFDRTAAINVAVVLPFDNQSGRDESYAEFVNGMMLALDDLKSRGVSSNVRIISFGHHSANNETVHTEELDQIINSGELDNVSLIIGPVFPVDFRPWAEWATHNRVPIVSPLTAIPHQINSPFVFQATPLESIRYEKLRELFNSSQSNVVVMKSAQYVDQSALTDMKSLMPADVFVMEGVTADNIRSLAGTLEVNKENVIVLPITDENIVSSILEKINLLNSSSRYKITVIGLARWARFNAMNVEVLFKLNTTFVTNYHEARSEPVINNFYARYIANFKNIPTVFSMRGYDISKLFVSAMAKYGPEMLLNISNFNEDLLQVRYRFEQQNGESSFVNRE